jgi:carboxypeptidase C (cathepsin A)
MLHPTSEYVDALLERGVRVLSAHDWIRNWVENEKWAPALEWSGKEEAVEGLEGRREAGCQDEV